MPGDVVSHLHDVGVPVEGEDVGGAPPRVGEDHGGDVSTRAAHWVTVLDYFSSEIKFLPDLNPMTMSAVGFNYELLQ